MDEKDREGARRFTDEHADLFPGSTARRYGAIGFIHGIDTGRLEERARCRQRSQFDGAGCPMCIYENGRLIESCVPCKERDDLREALTDSRSTRKRRYKLLRAKHRRVTRLLEKRIKKHGKEQRHKRHELYVALKAAEDREREALDKISTLELALRESAEALLAAGICPDGGGPQCICRCVGQDRQCNSLRVGKEKG